MVWLRRGLLLLLLLGVVYVARGCFSIAPSSGGGQTSYSLRTLKPSDVELPPGYRIEVVAQGLTFPSAVAFDERGQVYVLEAGYSYGEVRTVPRLLRLEPGGPVEVARGDNPPWNGLSYHQGFFYIAEGGEYSGGQILKVSPLGAITPVVSDLPSLGDHHTNRAVVGPDGYLYFGQGTATNSAVVGLDDLEFGWLARHPQFHDIPCRDIQLAGRNFQTDNPLTPDPGDKATTGAYSAFGTPSSAGQVVRGQLPCNGAVMRLKPQGGALELVAWGFRNPFGLAFSPDGMLYVADNSYDERGSRPVFGTGDLLWQVNPAGPSAWYGWPDYHGDMSLDNADHFGPPGGPPPGLLLAQPPGTPPKPSAKLGVHSSSNGLDFSRSTAFGFVGQAFVAQFGDMAPGVGKVMAPVGFMVVRVDVHTGAVYDFAVNRGKTYGPASRLGSGGLERPIDARFDPQGTALYVVDFGVMTIEQGPKPRPGTGVVWKISRGEP